VENFDAIIKPDEELLDPKYDIVFKAMLTTKNEYSEEALRSIISAFTGKEVKEITVVENEVQGGVATEKHVRLDVNCEFDNGNLANIEMTMEPAASEFLRLEQYLSRIHGSIPAEGVDYKDYPDSYQISIIGDKSLEKTSDIINFYEMCNLKTGKPIGGKMHIITAELKKLREYDGEIESLDTMERWAAYFAWISDTTKRDKINKLISMERGIRMATESLRKVSSDPLMKMKQLSQMKATKDWKSDLASERNAGVEEGITQGITRGISQRNIEIAKKLLLKNMDLEDISDTTGLTVEEIEKLKDE
jgi:predicted transposase/invertase (TIGR01784 family)